MASSPVSIHPAPLLHVVLHACLPLNECSQRIVVLNQFNRLFARQLQDQWPSLGACRACVATLIHASQRFCPLSSLDCCARRRLRLICAAGAVSHSAKLVAGLRAVESEEGPGAALFDDPLAGVLAGDEVVRQAQDYAMVTLCDPVRSQSQPVDAVRYTCA